MVATSRSIDAPSEIVPLSRIVFIRLCEMKGAYTEAERAALAGSDRGTVRRWLNGEASPRLADAQAVARTLDSTVDELWPAAK
jgi:transcriptional regulator with XRE-family HTH domain